MTAREIKPYHTFPREYATAFLAARDSPVTLGPFASEKEAKTAARDLYRFRRAVQDGLSTDPADTYALTLHRASECVRLTVAPSLSDGTHASLFSVILSPNPLIAAVRSLSKGAAKDANNA